MLVINEKLISSSNGYTYERFDSPRTKLYPNHATELVWFEERQCHALKAGNDYTVLAHCRLENKPDHKYALVAAC